eukprot:10041448-Ditylum_brightwellii.AAC.1
MHMRLLSPQGAGTSAGNPIKFSTFSLFCGKKGYVQLEVMSIADGWEDMPPVYIRRMDLHPRNNLPWFMIRTKKTMEENVMGLQRLCHVSFSTIQLLARSRYLPFKNPNVVDKCQIPVCASCQFTKQKRRPHKATKSQQNPEKEGKLKKNNLFPEERLSADHYKPAVLGRTYSSRGNYHPEDMFNSCTIFVDHASDKIFVYHQQSLSAAKSIKSILRLDMEAAESGVRIEALHTDNGTFSSTELMSYLATKQQPIRFSEVGAVHQNAIAKRAIQTIICMARTLLVHTSLRSSSGTITSNHWPMAMDYTAWVYNHMPAKENGLSPNDKKN